MNKAILLLADPSPNLRHLVLREILHRSENDGEILELDSEREQDPIVLKVISKYEPESLGSAIAGLRCLGYLGYGPEFEPVRKRAELLFSRQRSDGSWPVAKMYEKSEVEEDTGYAMIPLQTALPLMALSMSGYAEDPRAENGFDWLEAQRLEDGAWPSGITVSGVNGYVAGYRKFPHSRWGCRSNTTGALAAFASHPKRRSSETARRALDMLLSRETRERHCLGFEVARIVGGEETRGLFTFFARFDPALLLSLCEKIGAGRDDPRVARLIAFIEECVGPGPLWEYLPKPHLSRWITFDILRSLEGVTDTSDWLTTEPSTAFQPYSKILKRF